MTTIVLWGLLTFVIGFSAGLLFAWLVLRWLVSRVELD